MAEFAHLIESLSMEVVLIGLVVSLFVLLAHVVWNCRDRGVRQALSEDLETVKRWSENGKLFWLVLAAVLVIASQLGTIFVVVSDEVLDSKKLIESRLFLYVPPFGKTLQWDSYCKKWKEEDQLKLDVLKDASERAEFAREIKVVLKRHLPEDKGGRCSNCDEDDCAKGFFQHANAVVIGDHGGDGPRDELRHEKHVVRLLSIIFVGIWLLFFVALLGPFVTAVWDMLKKRRHWKALVRAVVFLAILWILEGMTLRLWTEQSKRYNRRLVHFYVAIASYGDPAMNIPIVKSP